MTILILCAVTLFATWRAMVNYLLYGAALKQYGNDWLFPRSLPNFAMRTWLWGLLAFLGIVGVFGQEYGLGLLAMLASLVVAAIAKSTNSYEATGVEDPEVIERDVAVISKAKSAPLSVPSVEIEKTYFYKPIESDTPTKSEVVDWLKDGNIRCTSCGKQDIQGNFLESSAGSNFKKCPSCNANFQIKDQAKPFGLHGATMNCPKCAKSGDPKIFLQSDAGADYAQCPQCGMNFHI